MSSKPLTELKLKTYIGVLKDSLTGGKAGFLLYPLQQALKLTNKDTINIVFTGASTGFSPFNSRYNTVKLLSKKTGLKYQFFRWGDLDKAILWSKKLPKGAKVRVVGYSYGADAANLLARVLKAPVSQIDAVTRKPSTFVPWTRHILPSNRKALDTLNNFVAYISGRFPLDRIKKKNKEKYQGLHCEGVNKAIKEELSRLPIKPSKELLLVLKNKPVELINSLYKYSPIVGAGLGFGAGYGLSKAFGVKSTLWKVLNGGTGAVISALLAPRIVDFILHKYYK